MYIVLFPILILLYWFAEGVTEGYTWASQERRGSNKLIHPNNGNNGLFDYHVWRFLENLGIWGAIACGIMMGSSWGVWLIGIGAWFMGVTIYEFALNHVCSGSIYKKDDFTWHFLGIELEWPTGPSIWGFYFIGLILFVLGVLAL